MAVFFGSLMSSIIGVIIVFLASLYLYFRYFVYNYWKKRGVPYVEPMVPFGNVWPVLKGDGSPAEFCAKGWAENKKNRFYGMYVFNKPLLVLTDPELIKHVIVREFQNFHDRGTYCNEKMDPLSGQLFLLSGAKWRQHRVKLAPTFSSGKIKQMFGIIAELGEKLAVYLKPKAEARESIEIKDLYAKFGTDVIMTTAFGIKCDSLENPDDVQFLYWANKILRSGSLWQILTIFGMGLMDLLGIPATDVGATKFFIKILTDTVENREKNNIKNPDFLNLLMQLMKRGYVEGDDDGERKKKNSDNSDEKFTLLEASAHASIFFIAGFESTATMVTYCLYELSMNQDVQDKVRSEIDDVLGKFGGLTYESLREMKYLQMVVSETLRKYPTVPMVKRICTNGMDLPTTNLHIEKGVQIVIPLVGLHRDPEIYPNPDVFDPERFNEANIAARHPYAYLPFGEGPRICIGMRFAEAQGKVAIISTLAKYRVKLAPNTPKTLKYSSDSFTLYPRDDVLLVIEPR